MSWYHHNPTQPTEPGRTAIIGWITVNTYRSLTTICLVLNGSNRTANIMMYLHFSHSIEHRFASVESKRRQDFYHLLLPVTLAFHNQSLLKNKTSNFMSNYLLEQGSVLSSQYSFPRNNHDHFLLCLAMLSLVKLPLRAEPPPPAATPWGGPITAPGGLSPAAETGGAIWPTVALPKQTHTQRSHISVKTKYPGMTTGGLCRSSAQLFLILEAGTTASVLTWSACPQRRRKLAWRWSGLVLRCWAPFHRPLSYLGAVACSPSSPESHPLVLLETLGAGHQACLYSQVKY